MNHLSGFLVLFIFFTRSCAQNCVTPLGRRSYCVTLFRCPELSTAFNTPRLSEDLVDFLRNSKCGFEGSMPKVCCGPLPSYLSTRNTNQYTERRPSREQYNDPDDGDQISRDDSYLTPRGQCGIDQEGNKIVGGTKTDLDEYPWMALLGYRASNGKMRYECGGVLINWRYVLTAAHCLVGAIEVEVGKLETVRLGEYDTQSEQDCLDDVCADPVQEIPVQSAYPHPRYSDHRLNKADDIGLVRLTRRARSSYYVQPICLVSANSPRLFIGDEAVVSGWGKTLSGKKSPVKQKVRVPIYNREECVNKYRTLQVDLQYSQICAGGRQAQDSCRGDSGGPLMRMLNDGTWESIGIVSLGFGCGKQGWPGIYTAVGGYLDWIKNTMESTNRY